MKRSILRASLGSCLVALSTLALVIGCESDSSDDPSDHEASAGEATAGGTAAGGGNNSMGGGKAQAGTSSNGGSPYPTDNEAGAPANGGTGGTYTAGGAGSDNGGAEGGAGGEPPCVPEAPTLPSNVPAGIVVAETATLLRSLRAVGTQNYRCTETPGEADADPTFGWVFVEPVADLFNSCGVKVGSHFAVPDSDPPAPEWKYEVDGSSVIGLRLGAAPVVGSIPELLLKEDGHGGAGVFAGVTFVQRLQTVGGLAPDVGECTVENVDEVVEVGYTAQYYFYSGGT